MLNHLIQFRSRDDAIHLTFDDGPHPDHTPRILDALAAHDARATFFVVGHLAEKYPKIVERIGAEGHTVANHTWTHTSLLFKRLAFIRQEVAETDRIIATIVGSKPLLFRPPHGRFGVNVLRCMHENRQRMVLWNNSTGDYKSNRHPESIASQILNAYPGSILLLHDGHKNSAKTVAGLKKALKRGIALPLRALE
jgi:peptidoglycan/xylan/chitin deacetylase (PgdA/CDA1 family)